MSLRNKRSQSTSTTQRARRKVFLLIQSLLWLWPTLKETALVGCAPKSTKPNVFSSIIKEALKMTRSESVLAISMKITSVPLTEWQTTVIHFRMITLLDSSSNKSRSPSQENQRWAQSPWLRTNSQRTIVVIKATKAVLRRLRKQVRSSQPSSHNLMISCSKKILAVNKSLHNQK